MKNRIETLALKSILGTLSEEEKRELISDSELKEQVDYECFLINLKTDSIRNKAYNDEKVNKSTANRVIEFDVLSDLKQKGVVTHNEGVSVKSETKNLQLILIAASFLILVVAGGYWVIAQNYSNFALASNEYQPPGFTDVISTLGDKSAVGFLSQAKIAYENKEFDKAIELLSSISEASPIYMTAQYNLGILFFNTQQTSKAISAFSSVKDSEDIRYFEAAEWYIVLTFLQSDNLNLTEAALDSLLQNSVDSTYKDRAKMLKKDLNSFWRKIIM